MPILALHGFTGCGRDFAPLETLLHRKDAQVPPHRHEGGTAASATISWHCPDLPGHGPEAQLDCTPAATRHFIQKQLPTLPDTQPKILLGYSMGARAALLHATAHPELWDALILISPNPGIEDAAERAARRKSDESLALRIEREGIPAFLEFWQNTPIIRSQQNIRPDWLHTMQASRLCHTAPGLTASLRQFGQGSCPNLWPELSKLTMPVLCITGAVDEKYGAIAAHIQARLPHATHHVIPAAGHMPHLEAPDPTAAAIRKFVDKQSV